MTTYKLTGGTLYVKHQRKATSRWHPVVDLPEDEVKVAASFIRGRRWYKKKNEGFYIAEVSKLEGTPMEKAEELDRRHRR